MADVGLEHGKLTEHDAEDYTFSVCFGKDDGNKETVQAVAILMAYITIIGDAQEARQMALSEFLTTHYPRCLGMAMVLSENL